ncbi:MAG: Calvin cycle protein CP12 [Xenococcaceae cyanobacterium]
MVNLVNKDNSETSKSLEMRINEAIEQARSACSVDASSTDCVIAWDIVEELSAEKSHQRFNTKKTSLEVYCDLNPDADECRMYDT